MPVPFSFQAQKRSSSPEFSEDASFLQSPAEAARANGSADLHWAPERGDTEKRLPAEDLFRSGVNKAAESNDRSAEPAAITPKPRLPQFSKSVETTARKPEPAAPRITPSPFQAVSKASPFTPASNATSSKPVDTSTLAPEPQDESKSFPPTATAAASHPPAESSRTQALPRTAEDGWRASELAVARREIARLKAKAEALEQEMANMRTAWEELRNDPPAPDHRKVLVMLEQWMSTHLDSVVEQSVRDLFGQKASSSTPDEPSGPWFRQQPLVSVSRPESTLPPEVPESSSIEDAKESTSTTQLKS